MNSVLVVLVALAGLLVDVDAQLVPYPYAPVPYAPVPADYGANYGGAGVYEDAAYNSTQSSMTGRDCRRPVTSSSFSAHVVN